METEEEKKKRMEEFIKQTTVSIPLGPTYRRKFVTKPEPEPAPQKPETKKDKVLSAVKEAGLEATDRAIEAGIETVAESRIGSLKGRGRLLGNLTKQIPKDMAAGYLNKGIEAVGSLLEKPATKGVRYIAEKITGKPSKIEVKIGTRPVYGGGDMSPETFRSKMEYETMKQTKNEREKEKIFAKGRIK
jgi:hypothetical protein